MRQENYGFARSFAFNKKWSTHMISLDFGPNSVEMFHVMCYPPSVRVMDLHSEWSGPESEMDLRTAVQNSLL